MEVLKDIYTLIAATNGEEALELAQTYLPPDLILLDIMMPKMKVNRIVNSALIPQLLI